MRNIVKFSVVSMLFVTTYNCNRIRPIKEYYNDGSIKSTYYINNDLIEGEYKLYYKHGVISELRKYHKGHVVDTIKYFTKKGDLKGGSYPMEDSIYTYTIKNHELIKDGVSLKSDSHDSKQYYSGWVKYYDNGLLKKKILYKYIHSKGAYKNQYFEYDEFKRIVKPKSCYFKLSLKDTMILGSSYLGQFTFNSDMDRTVGFFTIMSDSLNKNFENINQIELDTFYNNTNPDFVYTPKSLGLKTLRGKFTEQFMVVTENQKDTTKIDVSIKYRDFYFEKDVFIKDILSNGTD